MKCKYCHEEIRFEDGRWKDELIGSICGQAPSGEIRHAPEDSTLVLIARIDTLIAEAEDNFKEIKRLSALLKEGR